MKTSVHKQLLTLVNSYDMPEPAKNLLTDHAPLILCGITAAGKNTLSNELIQGGSYEAVVSHTTRQPRYNHGVIEEDGVSYHFVDEEQMLQLVTTRRFVEVKSVHGKVYGTSLDALTAPIKRGNVPVLEIDVQGAEELVAAAPSLSPIFLLPPSFAVWRQRLQGRGDMPEDELLRRMQSALKEIQAALDNQAFAVVINHDKAETAQHIRSGPVHREPAAIEVAQQLVHDIRTHFPTI
jgi:guanylate kinase